ncbi:MAG: hypothetical protein QOG68_2147 [Solirubrobacteraceae bacterium]|nr:hypothetical protein [Solirubrobacteraceae bacterium]
MGKEVAALGLILAVHLVAVGVLLWAMLGDGRVDWRGWWPGDDGPGDDPVAPVPPGPGGDGLPLPGAVPAGMRLRTEHERLAAGARRVRRPAHAPEPERTRTRPGR